MAYKTAYFVVYLVAFATSVFSTCWTPRNEDIEWNRVPFPWYDVLDIPKPAHPISCWTIVNSTETNKGVILTYIDYTGGEIDPPTTSMHFIRTSPGVYLMSTIDVETMSEAFDHLVNKAVRTTKEEERIHEEMQYFTRNEWTFLTDYENYFMIVRCSGSDWNAYAKSLTPRITVDQLQMISQSLVDNGLQSPTMTLKNECLNTGDEQWNKADVVIA